MAKHTNPVSRNESAKPNQFLPFSRKFSSTLVLAVAADLADDLSVLLAPVNHALALADVVAERLLRIVQFVVTFRACFSRHSSRVTAAI